MIWLWACQAQVATGQCGVNRGKRKPEALESREAPIVVLTSHIWKVEGSGGGRIEMLFITKHHASSSLCFAGPVRVSESRPTSYVHGRAEEQPIRADRD